LSEAAPRERSSIVLEGGQRISFSAVKNADGETAGATIDLSYRETRLSRAAALYLRRLGFTAGDLWREPRSAAWKPALTFAALMVVALGLIYYWRGHEGAPREKIAGDTPPRTIETPAPPSLSPGASPTPRNEKRHPAPAPRRRPDDSPMLIAQREQSPNEILRGKRLALDGASLLAVKKVHVDPFGDDSIGKQFHDQLTSALRANRRFSLTANREEADAVLKGKITTTPPEQVSATVRLVNAKGAVLWPINGHGAGRQYQGPVATVTSQIARDLLADMDKAERK
jgi:hypothetical protein